MTSKVNGGCFLLLFVVLICVWRSTCASQDVSRLPLGVNFRWISTLTPGNDVWRHTFVVKLPTRDSDFDQPFNLTRRMMALNETNREFVKRRGECFRQLGVIHLAQNSLCYTYRDTIRFMIELAETSHTELTNLITAIYSLLPDAPAERSQRALLGFLQPIMKSVFGFVGEDDINALQNTIRQMAEQANENLRVIKKSSTDLTSFIVQSNDRTNRLVHDVKMFAIEQAHLYEQLSVTQKHVEEYGRNLSLHIFRMQFHTQVLASHYEAMLSAVEALTSGFLSPYLVSAKDLQEVITDVQTHLQEQHAQIHLIHESTQWYYRYARFFFVRKNNNLLITVQFPVTAFNTAFDVYKVITIPLSMHDDSEHVTEISDLPFAYAIDKSHTYWFEFNEVEVHELLSHPHAVYQPVVRMVKNTDCLFLCSKGIQK